MQSRHSISKEVGQRDNSGPDCQSTKYIRDKNRSNRTWATDMVNPFNGRDVDKDAVNKENQANNRRKEERRKVRGRDENNNNAPDQREWDLIEL